MPSFSRRSLIQSAVVTAGGLVVAGTLAGCSDTDDAATASTTTTLPVTNGDEALARLVAGNARYASGAPVNQGRDTVRRVATAEKQSPYAVILTCSDSRVSPEVVFDEGVGDLFVVRVAGNTAETPIVQGTIEYGIEHLHAILLMVLGHEGCGAVNAALVSVAGAPPEPGQIPAIITPIIPAAKSVQSLPEDEQMDAAIKQNIANQAGVLKTLQPILAPGIASGHLTLVQAEYMLESGKVEILT